MLRRCPIFATELGLKLCIFKLFFGAKDYQGVRVREDLWLPRVAKHDILWLDIAMSEVKAMKLSEHLYGNKHCPLNLVGGLRRLLCIL
jgi:hypothetical protein